MKKNMKSVKKGKAEKEEEEEAEEPAPEKKQPEKKDAAGKRPQKKDKGEKKEKVEKKDLSPAEKEKLTKEAVAEILELVSKPEAATGLAIPHGWITKYKAGLGSYKKFCQSQTTSLQVVECEKGGYLVLKVGAKAPPGSTVAMSKGAKAKDWKNMLQGAWSAFCQAVPAGEDRLLSNFLKGLPKGVTETGKAGSPKLTPKSSPQLSPKGSPKADPAEPPVINKKRSAPTSEGGSKKKKLKKKA